MKFTEVFLLWSLLTEKKLNFEDNECTVCVGAGINEQNQAGLTVSIKWNDAFTESEVTEQTLWKGTRAEREKIFYRLYLQALQKIKDHTNRKINLGFPTPDRMDLPDEMYERLQTLFIEEDF